MADTADERPTRSWSAINNVLRSYRACDSSGNKNLAARYPLPKPSSARLLASSTELPFDVSARNSLAQLTTENGTILYLAYGSNLCYQTFQGMRGIRPLASINVVVPELRMTFDLAGLPYAEPCFANSATRIEEPAESSSMAEKLHREFGSDQPDYHKDHWKKGMVGVVYEVTLADYVHIIATEGGGSAYQDVVVTCHALPDGVHTVPTNPTEETAFRAHTLFTPPLPPPKPGRPVLGPVHRPDPSYAQPSARYLKLISDGADEHSLPGEYKDFIHSLRPYTVTTQGQRLGQFILLAMWGPFIQLVFAMSRLYQDENGRSPRWLVILGNAIFNNMWLSYDSFFKPLFGDGERTIYDDGDEAQNASRWSVLNRRNASQKKTKHDTNLADLEDLKSLV